MTVDPTIKFVANSASQLKTQFQCKETERDGNIFDHGCRKDVFSKGIVDFFVEWPKLFFPGVNSGEI